MIFIFGFCPGPLGGPDIMCVIHSAHVEPLVCKIHVTTLPCPPQLDMKPWRRPLTMGHQQSEMRDQFQARPEAISRVIPHSGNPQPPTLADHFSEGPTKVR